MNSRDKGQAMRSTYSFAWYFFTFFYTLLGVEKLKSASTLSFYDSNSRGTHKFLTRKKKLEIKKWGGLKWTRKILSFVVKKITLKKYFTTSEYNLSSVLWFFETRTGSNNAHTVHGIKKFFYFFLQRISHIACAYPLLTSKTINSDEQCYCCCKWGVRVVFFEGFFMQNKLLTLIQVLFKEFCEAFRREMAEKT